MGDTGSDVGWQPGRDAPRNQKPTSRPTWTPWRPNGTVHGHWTQPQKQSEKIPHPHLFAIPARKGDRLPIAPHAVTLGVRCVTQVTNPAKATIGWRPNAKQVGSRRSYQKKQDLRKEVLKRRA